MLVNQAKNLNNQLFLSSQNGLLSIPCIIKSANHPDLEKFNKDKTKLDTFLAQFNLKLQYNLDHFIKKDQETK